MSSDSLLIECSPIQDVEKKLVDLVSSLMEEQDQIISESNPGKKMCHWVHDKTMFQLTVGTLKDSAYGEHTDCGFHHNRHKNTSESFMKLPSDELMRVVTLFCLMPRVPMLGYCLGIRQTITLR